MKILSFSKIANQVTTQIKQKCGLNSSQARILLYFNHNGNKALTIGHLAAQLNISLSTLSRQLQQKRTQELIKIVPSETDSSKNVQLNELGLKKVTTLISTLKEIEQQLDIFSTKKEEARFDSELAAIIARLK